MNKSQSFNTTLPLVGTSKPAKIASSVDFPAPDAPTMATDSPVLILKLILFSKINSPSGLKTVLFNSLIESKFFVIYSFMITSLRLVVVSFLISLFIVDSSFSDTPLNHVKQIKRNILIFGDSISAGYGLKSNESWSHLLQNRLINQKYNYKVINASLSGDTTGGGKLRIENVLRKHQPDIVLIELGGNDGLRGLSLKTMKNNLSYMIDLSLKFKHQVLLVGMQLPPNYGKTYTKQFSNIYKNLATDKNISLVPFLLSGIAEDSSFFQNDQIHPNAKAQTYLLDNVWVELKPMLQ